MKYKKGLILVILIMIIMGILSGCVFLPKEDEKLTPPIVDIKKTEYKTEKVKYGTVNKDITSFGSFKPMNEIRYSFEDNGGIFLQFYYKKNDNVKKGDVLAQLDIGDLDIEIRDMSINLEKSKLNFDRATEQYESNIISEYDYKIEKLNYKSIQNKYNDLLLTLKRSQIVAKEDGTVSYLAPIEEGDTVEKGDVVLKLILNNEMSLVCIGGRVYKFNSSDLVTISSLNNSTEGKIISKSRNKMVVKPNEIFKEWKLGTSVMITQNLNTAENVLMINQKAINDFGGRTYAKILKEGVPIEKEVQLGITNGRYYEVISGLEEGDEAIIY